MSVTPAEEAYVGGLIRAAVKAEGHRAKLPEDKRHERSGAAGGRARWNGRTVEDTRAEILGLLTFEPQPVRVIAEKMRLRNDTARHHIQVMFEGGLIDRNRHGAFLKEAGQ